MQSAWQERLPTLTGDEQAAFVAELERAQGTVAEIRQRWQERRTQLRSLHRGQAHRLRCACLRECARTVEETANGEDERQLAALEEMLSK